MACEIPIFVDLFTVHDLSRRDAMVYGLISSAYTKNEPLTVKRISVELNIMERHVWKCIAKLVERKLVRRYRRAIKRPGQRGRINRYVPLGPKQGNEHHGQEGQRQQGQGQGLLT